MVGPGMSVYIWHGYYLYDGLYIYAMYEVDCTYAQVQSTNSIPNHAFACTVNSISM